MNEPAEEVIYCKVILVLTYVEFKSWYSPQLQGDQRTVNTSHCAPSIQELQSESENIRYTYQSYLIYEYAYEHIVYECDCTYILYIYHYIRRIISILIDFNERIIC